MIRNIEISYNNGCGLKHTLRVLSSGDEGCIWDIAQAVAYLVKDCKLNEEKFIGILRDKLVDYDDKLVDYDEFNNEE